MLITVGKHSKMPDTGAIFIDPGLTALDSEHRIAPLLAGPSYGACYLLLSAGYSRKSAVARLSNGVGVN